MARRRFIPPDFWESPTATSLSAGARLFLLGCWTAADDEGLLRWDADEFKERLFPSDTKVSAEAHIAGWMQDLIRQRLVLPYRDRTGGNYGYLLNFEREHKVARPVASTLPPPNPRHYATINAYAWRDKGSCPRCGTVIHPVSSTRNANTDTAEVGVVVPVAHNDILFPSQVTVVHQRCLDTTGQHEGDTIAAMPGDNTPEVSPEVPSQVAVQAAHAGSDATAVSDTAVKPAVKPATDPASKSASTDTGGTPKDRADVPADTGEAEPAQESLFAVPATMTKAPEPARKKKRKQPQTWTQERKDIAKSIMEQWWPKHGEGWTQSYGTVYGVIISVLSNKVPADDISKAMEALGVERKPISGGTIGFALSHPSKKVREQEAFKERSSASNAEKYQQRTL